MECLECQSSHVNKSWHKIAKMTSYCGVRGTTSDISN